MRSLFMLVCVLAIVINSMGEDKQKIIFDCDLGVGIDDAYAVALLLSSPEFEILGVE